LCPSHSVPTRRSSDLKYSRTSDVSPCLARSLKSRGLAIPCTVQQSSTNLTCRHSSWAKNQKSGSLFIHLCVPMTGTYWKTKSIARLDRKSTRLNSSHVSISYAV